MGVLILIVLAVVRSPERNPNAAGGGRDPAETFAGKPPPPDDDWQAPPPRKPPPEGGWRPPPPPSPLTPLAEIQIPLADGPAEHLWTQAKEYAKANPANYRDVLARLDQVRAKAGGTALEKEIEQAIVIWSTQKEGAVKKAIASFTNQMEQNAQWPRPAQRRGLAGFPGSIAFRGSR